MSDRVLLLTCGLLLATSAHAAPPPPPAEKVPTTDQIYASFESADYPRALRQIAAALALKGDAALQYDRHDLLTLKGETLVRLKNFPEAAAAFDDAARATIVESKAGADRCTAELLRRTRAGLYTPRGPKAGETPAPIDVTDAANRPAAFAAMFEESVPKVEAAVKVAKGSTSLPPVLRAYAMVRDLRMLEQVGAGADAKSMELGAALTAKATSLMTRAVADMSAELTRMQNATQPAAIVSEGEVLYHVDSVGVLERIATDSERVARLAADLLQNFPGDQADALRKVVDDAAALASRARSPADSGPVAYDLGEQYGPQQPANSVGPVGRRRGGTNSVQRPDPAGRGAGTAANRGVDTGGRR